MRRIAPDEGSHLVFTTADPGALQGLHEFLRFQIEDLKTGDSKEVRDLGNSVR